MEAEENMAYAETIKQVFAQTAVETVKAAIVAVSEENGRQAMGDGHWKNGNSQTANWRTISEAASTWLEWRVKYMELKNFEMEVANICVTKHY